MKVPAMMIKLKASVIYCLALPLFFFLFTVVYDPFSLRSVLDMGRGIYTFNVSILTAIVLVSTAASRALSIVVLGKVKMRWTYYILWCIAEMTFISLMASIYLTLMLRGEFQYFRVMGQCLSIGSSILVFPYVIVTMSVILISDSGIRAVSEQAEASLIRFRDMYGKIKFIVMSDALLYIEADENYVHIFYSDTDKVKSYLLRASMRSLEEDMARFGMVRCQRSYYVNPLHVKVLRKDKEGVIFAELDTAVSISVPVSRRYYDALSNILG